MFCGPLPFICCVWPVCTTINLVAHVMPQSRTPRFHNKRISAVLQLDKSKTLGQLLRTTWWILNKWITRRQVQSIEQYMITSRLNWCLFGQLSSTTFSSVCLTPLKWHVSHFLWGNYLYFFFFFYQMYFATYRSWGFSWWTGSATFNGLTWLILEEVGCCPLEGYMRNFIM